MRGVAVKAGVVRCDGLQMMKGDVIRGGGL